MGKFFQIYFSLVELDRGDIDSHILAQKVYEDIYRHRKSMLASIFLLALAKKCLTTSPD